MLHDPQRQKGVGGLYTLDETAAMIRDGRMLVVAADWRILTALPRGKWIGGVCTRFLTDLGCQRTEERAFVMDFSNVASGHRIGIYPDFAVESVYGEMPNNGFSFLLIPGFSVVQRVFGSQFAARRQGVVTPLVGFVAGADLGDSRMQDPFVIDGAHGVVYTDSGVALHCQLEESARARVEVVNPFSADMAGDIITFSSAAMVLRECRVNGNERNFASYIRDLGIPAGLPLVGEVQGMTQNVMVLSPLGRETVTVASPVLPSVEYRFARRDQLGIARYSEVAQRATKEVVASVHGYGNYVKMASVDCKGFAYPGPFALAEIAMLLMNQTTVNLIVERFV